MPLQQLSYKRDLYFGTPVQARAVIEEFSIEQIVPYFQPIFDLQNSTVTRYECLSRLIANNDNVRLPEDFLNIISHSQSNALLTQRMFELSSAYCNGRNMSWSINMFNSDLRDAGLISWMQSLFKNVGKEQIGVELSYDSVKHHPHLLRNLKEKLPHIHLTVDHVYEDEAQLKQILATGVQAIKLHGDMVTQYTKTKEEQKTIESIVERCERANCELIAEHIENEETLNAVSALGIQYGQGFYLSRPERRITSLKQL